MIYSRGGEVRVDDSSITGWINISILSGGQFMVRRVYWSGPSHSVNIIGYMLGD